MTEYALTWLAYSEREQQQAQNLAASLGEQDTRDELGIGSIRDAISDRLFPGTSTIQSRARYFLFLPWLFQILEGEIKGGARERTERAERDLIRALRKSDDTRGLVGGITPLVERLPSSVYWNGLLVLGIRRVAGPLGTYYRWLDDPRRKSRVVVDDDGIAIEGTVRTWWDRVPAAPSDFPDVASFALRADDSQYLAGRAVAATPHSHNALAFLFGEGRALPEVPFPWDHPQLEAMPGSVQDDLEVAKQFSLLHYGAALLYNQLIAEAHSMEVLADEYRASVEEWQASGVSAIEDFDLGRVWRLAPKSSISARSFIERWRRAVLAAAPNPIAEDRAARRVVTEREIRVKTRIRSRIANPHRVQWNGGSGSSQIDYRWKSSVQRICLDVAEGRFHA